MIDTLLGILLVLYALFCVLNILFVFFVISGAKAKPQTQKNRLVKVVISVLSFYIVIFSIYCIADDALPFALLGVFDFVDVLLIIFYAHLSKMINKKIEREKTNMSLLEEEIR